MLPFIDIIPPSFTIHVITQPMIRSRWSLGRPSRNRNPKQLKPPPYPFIHFSPYPWGSVLGSYNLRLSLLMTKGLYKSHRAKYVFMLRLYFFEKLKVLRSVCRRGFKDALAFVSILPLIYSSREGPIIRSKCAREI